MGKQGFFILATVCLLVSVVIAANGGRNPGDLQMADNIGEFAAALVIAGALARMSRAP